SGGQRYLLSLVGEEQLRAILRRMLDPDEFLSDYGIRSLSKYHFDHPYVLEFEGTTLTVHYEPAESHSGMFGGNSNWRGPIWFPMNYMLIDALRRFHEYWGDDLTVECPTGSNSVMTLEQVADELSNRLIRIFTRDANGNRAFHGDNELFQRDPHWHDYIQFNEYFHGDDGAGIGASHQTGWTGLIANLIQEQGERLSPAGHDAAGEPGAQSRGKGSAGSD
ncbi:MAG TPA: glucosidase, partial [Chloroflexota bacterium]